MRLNASVPFQIGRLQSTAFGSSCKHEGERQVQRKGTQYARTDTHAHREREPNDVLRDTKA